MSTLTFSHGIVNHSTDTGLPGGTANFLVINGSKVDLSAPFDQSFVTVFAHRDTNYLLTLQQTSDIEAWGYGSISDENAELDNVNGGGSGNNEYYLWIEIDRITGSTSYGHSNYQPSAGSSPPFTNANRPDGLHWFDTNQRTMKVWRKFGSTGKWVEVIRLFVAKYTYSASFSSLSINAPSYVGTTAGLVGQTRAGALIYDVGGKPVLRTDSNNNTTFFTTEDVFTSGLPVAASPVSGNRARYETFLVDAIGVAPAPAYSIVRFTDFNEVSLMSAAAQPTSLWGMIEFDIGASGDLVQVTMSGQVRNPLWNWSTVGQQIFVDKNNAGQLVTVEDDNYVPLPNQLPVGIAIDSKSILIRRPELALTVADSIGVTDHGALTGLGDDDHSIYHTDARANTWLATRSINGLGDVVLTGSPLPISGDVLTYNGSNWVHQAVVSTGGTNVGSPIGSVISHLNLQDVGTNSHDDIDTHIADSTIHFTKSSINLTDLGDVVSGSPATGNVLTWDGSRWEPQAPSGGGGGSPVDIVSRIEDADGDTFVDVELTPDADNVVIKAGDDLPSGTGGDVTINAGEGYGGGAVEITSGTGIAGGNLTIAGGEGTVLSAGSTYVKGGYGNGVDAGDVTIAGGYSSASDGGDVIIIGGGAAYGGFNGEIYIRGADTDRGSVRINDSDNSHYVEIAVPTTVTTNRVWTLPVDNPSTVAGQFITTNTGGVLSFTTIALDDLSNVASGSPAASTGDVLTWDGSQWEPQTPSGGGGSSDEITDADGDTFIRVEQSADEDIIRISTGADGPGNFPAQTDAIRLSSFEFRLALPQADNGNNDGGDINITAGDGGYNAGSTAGDGGDIQIFSGYGGSSDTSNAGNGGSLSIGSAGGGSSTSGTGGDGGNLTISSGYGYDNGSGGLIRIAGGEGDGTGSGGSIRIQPGSNSSSDALNGVIEIYPPTSTATTNIRFQSNTGANYVGIKSPNSVSTSVTWTLPNDDPTVVNGQFLTTDASGNLSFAAAGGGGSSSIPYDIAGQTIGSVPGGGGIDAEILRLKFPRAVLLNRSFVGSPTLTDFAEARVGPTSSFTLNIWITDSAPAEASMPATGPGGISNPIGTITFTPGSPIDAPVAGTITWSGSPSDQFLLPAGTTIIVEGVTATDATLSDIFYTIVAYET